MTAGCIVKAALWTERDAERRDVRSQAERGNAIG
jgi:hypothetical protein